MNRSALWGVIGCSLLLVLLLTAPTPAYSVCCPLPCETCDLRSAGQLNLISFDRAAGTVSMVPNLRFLGQSPDFALLVPTPALPTLSAVEHDFWLQADRLTAPAFPEGDSGAPLGCSKTEVLAGPVPQDGGDVTVHAEVQVGGMLAAILSSSDPDTLLNWLADHHYRVAGADASRLRPYIDRDWFFTAMRPDSSDTSHPMPTGGWDSNVSPVRFTWSGDGFQLPLEILDINRAAVLPITLYVVDDHRVTMAGFQTTYANHISDAEWASIEERYRSFAPEVRGGAWLTKLTRWFDGESRMVGTLSLERSRHSDEVRGPQDSPIYGDAWLLTLSAIGVLAATRGRRRREQ